MSNELSKNSLDDLAYIAHTTQELQTLSQQIKEEEQSGDVNKPSKLKRMACVECRQQKSRCDAHEKHPGPCTRCAKKGLKCDLRSDYKRTYKRARIAQIEKEFKDLKKTLSTAQAADLINKIPSLANLQFDDSASPSPQPEAWRLQKSTTPGEIGYSQIIDPKSSETNPSTIPDTPSIAINEFNSRNTDSIERIKVPEELLICEEKTLDTVKLTPSLIKTLFLEYVNNYHPILPVVDVMKGPEKIYKLCPALFWVIAVVSLRRINDDNHRQLLLQLSPIIKDVLAEMTISPITRYNPTEEDEPILNACSVYSVQALLVYTYWPPITSSLSADTSWNTIGLALFHGIRIGLNVSSQQVLPEMAQEQTKTWIICNTVSQTIATAFGFPAFVQFDSSIRLFLRQSNSLDINKSVRYMFEIALFEDQTAKTLNANPMDPYGLIDPTERLPLIKVLLRQLDELEIKLVDELSASETYRKYQLLVARVHLLTYYFMDSSRIAFFELQKGLVRLYNSAIALINFANLCQIKDKQFVKYLPSVYVLSLWQTSCIIAKLTNSPMKKYIDLGSGKQSYQAAISLAAKASILKHDMAHRSSGIMRNMWQVFRTLDENNLSSLTTEVRSRMSASVFFDCLYILRQQVGMMKLNSRSHQVNGGNPDNGESISNEDGEDDEEEEEYGYQDEDVIESDDGKPTTSQKSTPSSNTSSRTKKARSLSNTVNAELKARKIIQTIPLDPQPISASKRSSIFKIVNDINVPPRINSPPSLYTNNSRMAIAGNTINRSESSSRLQNEILNQLSVPSTAASFMKHNTIIDESPIQGGLENLEFDGIDINSDLLWKDVDSVMNDFGFHAQ